MGFGDYGGKGMKCVHGVEMGESCGNCWAQTAGTDMRIMPDFCVRKQPKTDDRLAAELASLTRSIQGLSGNVAKLVEEMGVRAQGADEIFRTEPMEMTIEEFDVLIERNRSSGRSQVIGESMRQAKQQQRHAEAQMAVKRGPVTDEEVIGAMRSVGWNLDSVEDAKMHYGSTIREYTALLTHLAKSRGLID